MLHYIHYKVLKIRSEVNSVFFSMIIFLTVLSLSFNVISTKQFDTQ